MYRAEWVMRGMSEVNIAAHLRTAESCARAKEPKALRNGSSPPQHIKLSDAPQRPKKARHPAPRGRRTAHADISFIFDRGEIKADAPRDERAAPGVWALVRSSLSTPPPPAVTRP